MPIIGICFAIALLAFLGALWLASIEKQEMLAKEAALLEKKRQVAPVANVVRKRTNRVQMRELARELRSLQNQAGEINERLHLLSSIVEDQLEQIASSRPVEVREELAV